MLTVPEESQQASDQAPTLVALPKRSKWGALLTRTLPKYSGPNCVGVTDLEVPVEKQLFGTFIHSKLSEGCSRNQTAGLELETSLISLFYPSKIKSGTSDRTIWFPKLKQTVDGFLRMTSRVPNTIMRGVAYPIAAAAIYGTTFPAAKDSKLQPPPPGTKYPLILFSHGVGCSRLMYTAICGELASYGYVVACVESRDGTGPSSSIRNSSGASKALDFINWKDLHWPDLPVLPKDDTTLRHVQLDLRLAEFSAALEIFKKINKGEGGNLEASSILSPNWDWKVWKDAIDIENIVIMGHSFGGSAAIKASADPRFNFSKVIVMDPAVQRIEPWLSTIPVPFLAINSQEFTDGMDDDYPRLLRVLESAPMESSFLFNIARATHPSFSDIHLVLPKFINRLMGLRNFGPEQVLQLQLQTSLIFLRGQNNSLIKSCSRIEGKNILFFEVDT